MNPKFPPFSMFCLCPWSHCSFYLSTHCTQLQPDVCFNATVSQNLWITLDIFPHQQSDSCMHHVVNHVNPHFDQMKILYVQMCALIVSPVQLVCVTTVSGSLGHWVTCTEYTAPYISQCSERSTLCLPILVRIWSVTGKVWFFKVTMRRIALGYQNRFIRQA